MSIVFPFILVRTAGLSPPALAGSWPDERAQETAALAAAQRLQLAFDAVLPTLPDSPLRTSVYNARKHFFQRRKAPVPAFEQLLATYVTVSGIAYLLDSLQVWKKTRQPDQRSHHAVEAALAQNWRIIQQAAKQPAFQRALLFASHDLLERLPAFCAKPTEQFTAKDRQTGLAVLQYLNRTAHKTSPFSHFTTVALWRWEQTPDLSAAPDFLQIPKAIVTPNVALLPALYEALFRDPAFYRSLQLTLNPCISGLPPSWAAFGTGQYDDQPLVWLYFDGEKESFQELAYHPLAAAVINICLAHQRQLPCSMLITQLQAAADADETQLQTFIFELIALGLLAWEWPERGLGASWCGGLYNYLGHLPTTPVITGAAALLQWLRTAARTLPFQPVAEAQATQRQTVQQVRHFFEQSGSTPPPIAPEQIFFEDVEQNGTINVPPEAIRQLTQQLADCWRQSTPQHLPPFRSALFAFTASELAVGESRAFLPFCRKFLEEKSDWDHVPPAVVQPYQGKIGALLQIFREERGQYGAVVNGLFPGGGKLLSRWLHLLPSAVREQMHSWFPGDVLTYPWQGWSNANFQPPLGAATLAVPDGRATGLSGGHSILLGDLEVQRTTDGPRLVDGRTGRPVWLTDLGLESPTTRPPVMQVLWHLGVPFVSVEALWPSLPADQPIDQADNTQKGWHYRSRLTYQSLVLLRAAWRVAPAIWKQWLVTPHGVVDRVLFLRRALLENGLPAHFFARFYPEKPQYFDRDSPACLLLLEKVLRHGSGDFYCMEMLPGPEQPVVEQGSHRTAEFVVEMQV